MPCLIARPCGTTPPTFSYPWITAVPPYSFSFNFWSFFFSRRRRHTRSLCDWSSDVCSSDLLLIDVKPPRGVHDHDVVIVDTAGRLHIDEQMMEEVARIQAAVQPTEILLVLDAMTRSEERRVGKECRSRWSPYH